MALPLSIYFILFAKDSIMFLSGTAYEGSIVPLQIIMPTVFLIGLSNIMGIQMLIPLGKEKMVLLSEVAGAIVDLALNAILIPRYASAGAAIGTLAAEFVVVLVQLWALREIVIPIIRKMNFARIFVPIVVATTVICLLKQFQCESYFLQLVWTAIVYFGTYGGLLLVMKEPLIISIVNDLLTKAHIKK